MEAGPNRRLRSSSIAISTPQPSTNGICSSTSRRPANSPDNGCASGGELWCDTTTAADERPARWCGRPRRWRRPVVHRLHEGESVVDQQGRDQTDDPVGRNDVTSPSHHTIRSPLLATSDAHSALPLPCPMPCRDEHRQCRRRSRRRRRRPRGVVGAAVVQDQQLVEQRAIAIRWRRAARSGPMVATSSRHGMHIETVRVPFRSANACMVQSSTPKVWTMSHSR